MAEKKKKQEIIEKFKLHNADTGSAAVQIALVSERIKDLSEHLKKHKKDFHSRRGLLMLVGKRRSLLNYLKKKNPEKYEEILKKLSLRK